MDFYRLGWSTLPPKNTTIYRSDQYRRSEFDLSNSVTAQFHTQALHYQQALSTPQSSYRLRNSPSDDITMSSLSSIYSQYQPMVKLEQPWEAIHEIPMPELLGGNGFTDNIAATPMQVRRERQLQFDVPNSPPGTLDPRKILRQFSLCSIADSALRGSDHGASVQLRYGSPPIDYGSPLHPSAVYQEESLLYDGDDSPPPSENFISSPPSKQDDDEDGAVDKPYAKLIYKALMQAPGHKMMLRDIYDWFEVNTTKPQESNSPSGWQNSIRHNLSMNQAFENERRDSSSGRVHTRKANSVWSLTDHAVKHGVQSTTRYRKHGLKKNVASRAPAAERQRSGAKDGQAIRKGGIRVRKQDDVLSVSGLSSCTNAILASQTDDMGDDQAAEVSPHPEFIPSTPAPTTQLEPQYSLSGFVQDNEADRVVKLEHSDFLGHDSHIYDDLFDLYPDPNLDGIPKIETE